MIDTTIYLSTNRHSLYIHALDHGVRSFDVTVADALSITLMATSGNRVGDIANHYLSSPNAWLRYEHIQLTIDDDDDDIVNDGGKDFYARQFRKIVAKFSLYSTKGHK